MATTKEDQFSSEEKEQVLGACAFDCQKCTICLTPIMDKSKNKCESCLQKMKASPTGFQFEVVGPDRKMFECPICLCLMRDATELPCEHLMCHDCLCHYERGQKEKAKSSGSGKTEDQVQLYCSICQTCYHSNKKYRVKSTDRMIQTSLPIKCLQKDCDWVGCIKDYQLHEIKCNFLVIPCPYFDVGCTFHVQRGQLPMHMEADKSTHEILVLKSLSLFSQEKVKCYQMINAQSKQLTDLKKTVEENTQDIKTFENAVATREKKIEALTKENIILNDRINVEVKRVDRVCEELKTQRKENEAMKGQLEKDMGTIKNMVEQKGTMELTKEIHQLNTKIQNQAENTVDLQTFADRISFFFDWLGFRHLQKERSPVEILRQAEFDKWNELGKFINAKFDKIQNEKQNESQLVRKLSDTMLDYKSVVYNMDWPERLYQAVHSMQPGVFFYNYIKFYVYGYPKSIGVEIYTQLEHFNRETSLQKWCRYETDTACHVTTETIWIALWNIGFKNIWVLHGTEEAKKKKIPISQIIYLEEEYFLYDGYVILEVEWNPDGH